MRWEHVIVTSIWTDSVNVVYTLRIIRSRQGRHLSLFSEANHGILKNQYVLGSFILPSILSIFVITNTNARKFACAQGSALLASHPPTHHFQNCNLCSKLTLWSWPDISQSILHPPSWKSGPEPTFDSATRGHLTTPRTRARRVGPRSFRVSGPAVWNSLPEDIANPELTLEHFKTGMRTHLFHLA